MKISDVLRTKGTEVVTIRPDESVTRLLEVLADRRVGALVVSPDGAAVPASSVSATSCGTCTRRVRRS